MLIFGGIHEVTKELDDMVAYNLKTKEWCHLFQEYVAPKVPEVNSGTATKLNRKQTVHERTPEKNAQASPTKIKSMASSQAEIPKAKQSAVYRSPKRKDTHAQSQAEILQDPTSITMMRSFLIKNSGPCFDNYAKAIASKKKAVITGQASINPGLPG